MLISSGLCAQNDHLFLSGFLAEEELSDDAQLHKYGAVDFSELWMHTGNHNVLGVIGPNSQRLRIAFTSIEQDLDNSREYHVTGKSKVKDNICDFTGNIQIDSVFEVKELHYGVDSLYKDSSIINQGVLFAHYKFDESSAQDHSGSFSGKLYSKWYMNSQRQIKYDDIESVADGFMNNAFVGTWSKYGSNDSKICNWADYRVPYSTPDFDTGAGEFSPSEKYNAFGWKQYQKAWLYGDEEAMRNELLEWWK